MQTPLPPPGVGVSQCISARTSAANQQKTYAQKPKPSPWCSAMCARAISPCVVVVVVVAAAAVASARGRAAGRWAARRRWSLSRPSFVARDATRDVLAHPRSASAAPAAGVKAAGLAWKAAGDPHDPPRASSLDIAP